MVPSSLFPNSWGLATRMSSIGARRSLLSIPTPFGESEQREAKVEPGECEFGSKEGDCKTKSALDLVLDEGTFTLIAPNERRLGRLQDLGRGPSGKYENLTDIISDTRILLAAYQRLRAKQELRIPLIGSQELPLNWFRKTREFLLAGSYDFQDYKGRHIVRRFGARATQHTSLDRYTFLLVNLWALRTKRAEILAGKCGFYEKKKADPLREFTLDFFLNYSIFSKHKPRKWSPFARVGDMIVQEAMNMALQKIYEPLLAPNVHGYRPNRGCHTLFEEIRGVKWLGVCWLMEFNFNNIFEKMDKNILASILEEDIEDKTFVELILKMFNVQSTTVHDVKYSPKMLKRNPKLENTQIEYKELGIRYSVLAPIICHIYLNRLDKEVHQIEEEQERVRPDHKQRTIFHVRANPLPATKELPINLKYARYMDEFVVGVGGSRAVVERIQMLMLRFMKNELHLIPDYATYSEITTGSILFLGMIITAAESTYNPRTEAMRLEKRKRCIFRNMKLRELREGVWSDRVRRLTLHAWASGLRRISKELPSLERCERLVTRRSEQFVRDLVIARLKAGDSRLAIEEILHTEHAVFYNFSAIGIPDEIVQAHQHLNELLETHYTQIIKTCKEKKRMLPDNKSKRAEMKQTYGALPIRLIAPLDTILCELRYVGMVKPDSDKPDPIPAFLNAPDESIVSYYAAIAYALLVYYRCSDNYIKVKRLVDYQVRWSAINSLAIKHDYSVRKSILEFKRGPQMINRIDVVASLPSTPAISRMGTMFCDNVQETMLENIMFSAKGSQRELG